MGTTNFSITPSIVLEYLYCPRFIYFMEVLKIDQYEDKRIKVQKGRETHNYKSLTNIDYKRKKLDVIDKKKEQELFSLKHKINGKIDEILFFKDGSAGPLDYKYAEYKGKIFRTYKTQSVMYAILIMDNYNVKSDRGYIVFTRSKNHIEEIKYTEKDFMNTEKILQNIIKIIQFNYYPVKTKVISRCFDCCYRNICIK